MNDKTTASFVSERLWSDDEGEHFDFGSPEDVVRVNPFLTKGDTIYYADTVQSDPGSWVSVEDVFNGMYERAWDAAGDCADDYPYAHVSQEAKDELHQLLADWARKHAAPGFCLFGPPQEYVIAAEDVENASS